MEIKKERERKTSALDGTAETGDLLIVDGELLEASDDENPENFAGEKAGIVRRQKSKIKETQPNRNQKSYLQHVFLPLVFLTVALFGGLRIDGRAGDFIFLPPPLVCLIFAAGLIVLFVRAGLIQPNGWFSESFSLLKNAANASVLLALFAAATQVFNSLLPERGLPFWIFAFCFFWTLFNNLFSAFDAKRLVQSLGGLFGFAFLVKYLVLAYIIAPRSENWWRGLFENPAREFFTYLLDLPRFAPVTGYIQFFNRSSGGTRILRR